MPSPDTSPSTEVYGRLKEGAHLAGYSFERACGHLEWLLQGERWKLGGQFKDVNKFIESIKLDQFRVVAEQRKRIAQRIKALQPKASQRAIAKALGSSNGSVHRALAPVGAASAEKAKQSATATQPAAPNEAPRTTEMGGSHAAQLLDRVATTRGTQGTGENEWYTPAEWLDRARAVLGEFDLDPASSEQAQRIVKAALFHSLDDHGLAKSWHGRIWMNPPYAQPAIGLFADKLASEFEAGRVTAAIALTHNYTDTRWFHRLASCASAVCFPEGRIRFVSPDGALAAPTQGQALFYLGSDRDLFRSTFGGAGVVLVTP